MSEGDPVSSPALGAAPGSVQLAVLLMHVSGGLAVVSGLVVGLATGLVVGWLAVALVAGGLWVWMAAATRDGKPWARITGTILFGVNTLVAGLGVLVELGFLYVAGMRLLIAFDVFRWGLALATVMLLWNRKSSRYYRNVAHPQTPTPRSSWMTYRLGGRFSFGGKLRLCWSAAVFLVIW